MANGKAATTSEKAPRTSATKPARPAAEEPARPAAEEPAAAARRFETLSGIPVKALYTEADLPAAAAIGSPGQYPYTRGLHPEMYRTRLWTMRQFAGFGTAENTNQRFHYLLAQGMTGLSTAFDMPTLMGYDPDHPMSLGEVGREGVAISSLEDMEILFRGIPLDQVTTSMTINAPAIVLLAMYVVVAEKQGIPPEKLGGTVQSDMLKEFIAQKEWICPPRPSVKICVDMIEWCAEHMPKWNSISISGYHIREAGATAVQELAFTIADGIGYVEECVKRGMDVDDFAPRLSFFWDVHNDFFEEIAKFRAGRRIWARLMKDRFHAKNPRSWQLRTHAQTAGVSLTAQQPLNNVARVALQGLAAVLGGTQSLHTNSMDETLALPTEEAATVALRTQQILAHESGVVATPDPLGGSYFVEALTDKVEEEALRYIRRIDEMGGIIAAVERGYPQKEIADSAYKFQQQVEREERIIVGVNRFVSDEEVAIPVLRIDPEIERRQIERIQAVRARRDAAAYAKAVEALRDACMSSKNLVPYVLDAVRAYATLGEVSDVFREAYGVYREPAVF
ncbi:MAG: methylmalonyl-CoA mutase [Candidatus Eisenbacteria bacterium]|uniref:Methylmalonyl-CoA mutase n=1 Tax=Eiseniibacteriota bacterium TaxID=2212470 RepID=A0A538TPS0_UNCEI|nr:MAG: methylmalonyl-CoA mutase [Candidatus Eisenbacteria bacterium]